jgi:hypothetical protein
VGEEAAEPTEQARMVTDLNLGIQYIRALDMDYNGGGFSERESVAEYPTHQC